MSVLIKKLHDSYLYALTAPEVKRGTSFLNKIKNSLSGGEIDILQLRLKAGTDRQKLAIGHQIRQLTRQKGVLFIVNDRLDFCRILEADGLHLGQDDIPLKEARKILGTEKIIGISTHTLDQAYQAERAGADYIGYGPCYLTNTKRDAFPPVKKEEINELRKMLKIPFFCIGGLSLKNLPPILFAGANRVAICAGIYDCNNMRETIRQIRQLLKEKYFQKGINSEDREAKNDTGPPKALTIAGSDSGGGAGIQADLKTFTSLGVWGLSVITALTAQNTLGVQQIFDVPRRSVEQQLASVLNDIGVDAVKTGMLWSPRTVEAVAESFKMKKIPLVVDPVLSAKRGEQLLLPEAIPILKKHLFPLASLITPNIPEAEKLTGISPIATKEMMKQAARKIKDMGAGNVLIKGGHLPNKILDLLFDGKEYFIFEKERDPSSNLHGVGCTLSAAVTAYLAQGLTLLSAIEHAQEFIKIAIRHSLDLGKGIGPVNPNPG